MDVKSSTKKGTAEKNMHLPSQMKMDDDLDGDLSDFDDIDVKEEDEWDLPDDDNSFLDVKLTDEDFRDDQDLDSLQMPTHDMEFKDEDFEVDEEEADVDDTGKECPPGVAKSLYFSEKQGALKKGYYKDGQPGRRKKAQRKDKGKSRFTAYMLWAREVRPDIIKKHPDMDFASVNKKLGELWQNVPTTQKYNWKRRAKRLAVRLRLGGMISTGRAAKNTSPGNSASASSSGHSSSTAASHGNSKQTNSPLAAVTLAGAAAGGGRQPGKRGSPSKGNKSNSPQKSATTTPRSGRGSQGRGSGGGAGSSGGSSGGGGGGGGAGGESTSPPNQFRVVGNSAIDVAAHMKLLGESLNNIGHKLKEHEGQIAVSGSLSVLLDSMLCVLGPLMCLTDQLQETRGAIDPQTHAAILDNIAYIMPGIV